jgi:MFS family permease
LPLPSYVPWIVVAAVGAGTVLSYAILAEYFPTGLAGRANAALNLFHIGGAFVVQFMTGLVVQLWAPIDGHYPEVAYQTAFAINVSLQIAAGIWFALTSVPSRNVSTRGKGCDASTLKLPQAFVLEVREPFLKARKSKRQEKGAANQYSS